MRTKTEQEGDDTPVRFGDRPERSVRYRIVVVIVSLLAAAGMVGTTIFAVTSVGCLIRHG